ncbi:MAG: Mov34/MPN/PAD-1 family protein [Fimbriimonadaceae bacterium]|nr:Mov34/MPN/PAD-1 family protein [Fimbriimonadaceae bacterium]
MRSMRRVKARNLEMPRVVFDQKALEKTLRFRQLNGQAEAGGILLGMFFPAENKLHVMFATSPGGQDARGPCSFKRDARRSTRIARIIWQQSKGQVHYLGEWHTHPEEHPRPSCLDRLSMARLLKHSTVVTRGLVLLIVGQRSNFFGFWTKYGFVSVDIEIKSASSVD